MAPAAADRSGEDEQVLEAPGYGVSPEWSRDSRFLAFTVRGDIVTLPVSDLRLPREARKPTAFAHSPAEESDPAFSPDTRWMAYGSIEKGRSQVCVKAFPAGGAQYTVSRDGGSEPRWGKGSREIYFLSPEGSIMAADVDTTNGFRSGVPHKLIDAGPIQSVGNHPYVVSQDGERFLYGVFDRSTLSQMTIVLNWAQAARE